MNLETQQFVRECLSRASAEIQRVKTPEEIEADRRLMVRVNYI